MLANTGTVSFLLYGLFIVISLIASVIGIRLIKKDTISAEKVDRIIDLFKYTIVSVAIATVTLIVSDLFKEREQDVKELEYFDKYAADVKNAEGITERFQLVKYLSIVSPKGTMKTAWLNYYDTIRPEYEQYLKNKKELEQLEKIENPSPVQQEKKQQLNETIIQKEAPLVSVNQPVVSKYVAAQQLEAKGFELLLVKDVKGAINAFRESENIYPSFHSVYEISRYLQEQESNLTDPNSPAWKEVYSKFMRTYSGYMPTIMKPQFRAKVVE